MEVQEAERVVVEVLHRIQDVSGRARVEIGSDLRPIGDLPEFDSLNGLELTVELSEALSLDLPQGFQACVDDTGKRALSVREIASRICSQVASSTGAVDG